jgi:hypothetical protein
MTINFWATDVRNYLRAAIPDSDFPANHKEAQMRVQIGGESLGRAGPAFSASSSVASVASCSKKKNHRKGAVSREAVELCWFNKGLFYRVRSAGPLR